MKATVKAFQYGKISGDFTLDMQDNKVIICKAIRVWEDTPGFEEETERRVAELFGMPVECTFSYGEFYCPGGNPNRSF